MTLLLPCPFCGCPDPELHATVGRVVYYYACARCGTDGPAFGSETDAIRAWNTRTGQPGLQPPGRPAQPAPDLARELETLKPFDDFLRTLP